MPQKPIGGVDSFITKVCVYIAAVLRPAENSLSKFVVRIIYLIAMSSNQNETMLKNSPALTSRLITVGQFLELPTFRI